MSISSTYKTSDFQLATFLAAEGFDLMNLDRTNPKRVEFIFKNNVDISNSLKNFWANKARINPRSFAYYQKLLKHRLYNA